MPWDAAGVAWDKVPEPGPEPSYVPPAAVELVLRNKIRVLVIENHRLPLVSVRVICARAGGREDGARHGLAALTGNLLVEGAGTLDSLALPEELERLGADLDVAVAADYAVVMLDTLTETIEPSLALLADVVTRPRLTGADFARIKGDAIEDIKRRPDSATLVAALVFDRTIFGDHPYGAPTTGTLATVERLALADAKKFWKTRYVPSAATIIVAGDVDPATLQALLDRTFGTWKGKRPPAAKQPPAPAPIEPQLVVVDRPGSDQAVVTVGKLGPDSSDPDYFAASVLNTALGGSFTSRLNHRLREELGYTYGVDAGFWRGAWSGSWSALAPLDTENAVDGIRELRAIIERTRTEGITADELANAKQLLIRGQPQDFETNAAIARIYTSVITQRRPLDWPHTYAASVRAVDGEAARAALAPRWSDLSIVVVGDWSLLEKPLRALGLPTRLTTP
jgi:zinc protease